MRVRSLFFFLSLPCPAVPFFDEFTKQQIPASGKGVPDAVFSGRQVKNIQYAEIGGKSLLLDLYLPEKPEGSPLVVWVHGGTEFYAGKNAKKLCSFLRRSGLSGKCVCLRWWVEKQSKKEDL